MGTEEMLYPLEAESRRSGGCEWERLCCANGERAWEGREGEDGVNAVAQRHFAMHQRGQCMSLCGRCACLLCVVQTLLCMTHRRRSRRQ